MMFVFKNKYGMDEDAFKAQIMLTARKIILLYPIHTAEKKWNKFLVEKYNKNLKILCLQLLNNLELNANYAGEVIATFKTKELEKLAAIITYGNRQMPGSNILRTALSN